MRYMKYIYTYPYTRIAPYLIGLILGYIISYKYSINGIYKKVNFFSFYWYGKVKRIFIVLKHYQNHQYKAFIQVNILICAKFLVND